MSSATIWLKMLASIGPIRLLLVVMWMTTRLAQFVNLTNAGSGFQNRVVTHCNVSGSFCSVFDARKTKCPYCQGHGFLWVERRGWLLIRTHRRRNPDRG